MRFLSAPIRRVLAVLVLGVAFLAMASVFIPRPSTAAAEASRAGAGDPRAAALNPFSSTDPHADLLHLGSMHGGKYVVAMYVGRDEPLYSVHTLDGREVGVLMTAAQVERRVPNLPLSSFDADTPESAGRGGLSPARHRPITLMRAEHFGGDF